jgi:predicted ATPase
MRLLSLEIEAFKNLRKLALTFDPTSPYTVFVGENGTGKSNLIEAITKIFRNLDLDLPAPFTYTIVYRCRDRDIRVIASAGSSPRVWVRDEDTSQFVRLSKRLFMSEDLSGRPLYTVPHLSSATILVRAIDLLNSTRGIESASIHKLSRQGRIDLRYPRTSIVACSMQKRCTDSSRY